MTQLIDALNEPNAWLTIPEFGVTPMDSDYKGFDLHVYGPDEDSSFGESLIPIVAVARDLVRKQFLTIAELDKVVEEVLDLVTVDGKPAEDSVVEKAIDGMSDRQSTALLYATVMAELSFLVWRSTDRTKCIQALALAAATLLEWTVHGPKETIRRTHGINRASAKLLRPSTKSPMRGAILKAMKPYKKDFQAFKSFMQSWEADAINGLRLTEVNDTQSYIVSDENGDLGQKTYKRDTLEVMYSLSEKS
jgi:hypothetical protein